MKKAEIFNTTSGASLLATGLFLCAMLTAAPVSGQRAGKVCDKGCANGGTARKKPGAVSYGELGAGQLLLNFGVGLVPLNVRNRGSTLAPPLDGSLDYMLSERFSLGLVVGHNKAQTRPRNSFDDLGDVSWINQSWYTGLRAAAHTNALGRWNIYGGFSAGLYHNRLTPSRSDEKVHRVEELYGVQRQSRTFAYSGFLGARCALNARVAAFGELGFSNSLMRLGLSCRLR